MDLSSAEDSKFVRMACGVAAVVICLSIGFRFVLDRALNKVTNSVTGGLIIVENVDSIVDNLDRLNINQRAFLATSDDRYSEEVAESVIAIATSLEGLKQIELKGEPLQRRVARLSRQIDWALESMEKTYELQQSISPAAAIALLDDDDAVAEAKMQAVALKKAATDGMLDRVETQRKLRAIFQVLF